MSRIIDRQTYVKEITILTGEFHNYRDRFWQLWINVREMASFLEKTNSFIRFLEPGKDGKAKECNEVKSIPYKSRQLDDMGWNETASTSYAGYDGHRSFKRADDVGAACACEA